MHRQADPIAPGISQAHGARCAQCAVVALALQRGGDLEGAAVAGGIDRRPGLRQDQRHAGFVEQDGVGLVEDGHRQAGQQRQVRSCAVAGLDAGLRAGLQCAGAQHARVMFAAAAQVVFQVVEHQFLGGHEGDVAAVGAHALVAWCQRHHAAHAQAQRGIERSQCLAVALHQVVVGGHQVHPHLAQRRSGSGQGGSDGLAFAGGHLGQAALQDQPGGAVLGVVRCLAERARHRSPCHGQGPAGGGTDQAVPQQPATQLGDGCVELRCIEMKQTALRGCQLARHGVRQTVCIAGNHVAEQAVQPALCIHQRMAFGGTAALGVGVPARAQRGQCRSAHRSKCRRNERRAKSASHCAALASACRKVTSARAPMRASTPSSSRRSS